MWKWLIILSLYSGVVMSFNWKGKSNLQGLDKKQIKLIERIAKLNKIPSLRATSGLRDSAEAMRIYNKRIRNSDYGNLKSKMDTLPDNQKKILEEVILRKDSDTGQLKYGSGNWIHSLKDLQNAGMSAEDTKKLEPTLKKLRNSFAGFQSGHFRGEKLDLKGDFSKQFRKDLQDTGHKLWTKDEPRGVLDITLSKEAEAIEDSSKNLVWAPKDVMFRLGQQERDEKQELKNLKDKHYAPIDWAVEKLKYDEVKPKSKPELIIPKDKTKIAGWMKTHGLKKEDMKRPDGRWYHPGETIG